MTGPWFGTVSHVGGPFFKMTWFCGRLQGWLQRERKQIPCLHSLALSLHPTTAVVITAIITTPSSSPPSPPPPSPSPPPFPSWPSHPSSHHPRHSQHPHHCSHHHCQHPHHHIIPTTATSAAWGSPMLWEGATISQLAGESRQYAAMQQ